MRNYSHFDEYYSELAGDVYAQPSDVWHEKETENVVRWLSERVQPCAVLDMGCGEGEAQPVFEKFGFDYAGLNVIGEEVMSAQKYGYTIHNNDYNFLSEFCYDESYPLIFSRHSLEHSPFPIITLMEWHRVSSKWLCVVTPNPQHFLFTGRNHYSVAYPKQTVWWLRRAGWMLNKLHCTDKEFWYLCEKKPRISYEGWAEVPLATYIYEFERDQLQSGADFQEYMKAHKHMAEAHTAWIAKEKANGRL